MVASRIFLDVTSGAPLNPAAADALAASLADGWANPARLHHEGRRARLLADAARGAIAARIGANPDELRFTASHPAALRAALGNTTQVVASAVEHSALLAQAATEVPVNLLGRVDPVQYAELAQGAELAALQLASAETGTCQPVAEVRSGLSVPLLMDANHAVGVIDLPEWDLLAAGANGWGGPEDVGILAVKRSLHRAPVDDIEPSVPLLVSAAGGLEYTDDRRKKREQRLRALTSKLRELVPRAIDDVEVVGDATNRLPHIMTFSCLYVDGEALVLELDRRGIAVSSGSACASDHGLPSHVLAAMGVFTGGNVRVSLPLDVDDAAIETFLTELPLAVQAVREVLA